MFQLINLTNKEKRSIVICILVLVIVFIVIEMYNKTYYIIDLETLSNKSLLKYKNSSGDNSYVSGDFMQYVSDGEYETAFLLLDTNNKKSMFNNDIQVFKSKLKEFRDTYSELNYNTMFSQEFENYTDEEILCMICNSNNESLHSIRFSIRTYKTGKSPKIIILNID